MVARNEAELILEALVQRVERIELTGAPQRRLNNTLRALASLPLPGGIRGEAIRTRHSGQPRAPAYSRRGRLLRGESGWRLRACWNAEMAALNRCSRKSSIPSARQAAAFRGSAWAKEGKKPPAAIHGNPITIAAAAIDLNRRTTVRLGCTEVNPRLD